MTESDVVLFLRGLSKPDLQRVVQTAVGRAQVVWPCPECDEIHSTHTAPATLKVGEVDFDEFNPKMYDVYVSLVDPNKKLPAFQALRALGMSLPDIKVSVGRLPTPFKVKSDIEYSSAEDLRQELKGKGIATSIVESGESQVRLSNLSPLRIGIGVFNPRGVQ